MSVAVIAIEHPAKDKLVLNKRQQEIQQDENRCGYKQ
jgi:hypothetical protein